MNTYTCTHTQNVKVIEHILTLFLFPFFVESESPSIALDGLELECRVD